MIAANKTRTGTAVTHRHRRRRPRRAPDRVLPAAGVPRPVRITIFEASGRLGGKVLTPSFTAAPVRYEAGAAEFYDYSPVGADPLRELVSALGLRPRRWQGRR